MGIKAPYPPSPYPPKGPYEGSRMGDHRGVVRDECRFYFSLLLFSLS